MRCSAYIRDFYGPVYLVLIVEEIEKPFVVDGTNPTQHQQARKLPRMSLAALHSPQSLLLATIN